MNKKKLIMKVFFILIIIISFGFIYYIMPLFDYCLLELTESKEFYTLQRPSFLNKKSLNSICSSVRPYNIIYNIKTNSFLDEQETIENPVKSFISLVFSSVSKYEFYKISLLRIEILKKGNFHIKGMQFKALEEIIINRLPVYENVLLVWIGLKISLFISISVLLYFIFSVLPFVLISLIKTITSYLYFLIVIIVIVDLLIFIYFDVSISFSKLFSMVYKITKILSSHKEYLK